MCLQIRALTAGVKGSEGILLLRRKLLELAQALPQQRAEANSTKADVARQHYKQKNRKNFLEFFSHN
jgi:hypothetical protein